MQFQLTDEQRALQDAVRSYLRDRFGPDKVRGLYEDPSADGVPADLWRALGEQGWLAVLVPEEHDGIGLGLLDAAVIARAFGAGTVPGPWTSTIVLGEALRLAGSPEQQKSLLPGSPPARSRAPSRCSRPARPPRPAPRRRPRAARCPAGSPWSSTPRSPTRCSSPPRTGSTWSTRRAAASRSRRTTRWTAPRGCPPSCSTAPPASGSRSSSPEVLQELLDRAAVLVANELVGIAR